MPSDLSAMAACGARMGKNDRPNQKYLTIEHRQRHYQARKRAQATARIQEAQCPQTTCTA